MQVKIQRTVPQDHAAFISAPSNRAHRESFDQVTMTKLLRSELESMSVEGIYFDSSSRLPGNEPKRYEFIIELECTVEEWDQKVNADNFDSAFDTQLETSAEGFGPDSEPSAVAAVGGILGS